MPAGWSRCCPSWSAPRASLRVEPRAGGRRGARAARSSWPSRSATRQRRGAATCGRRRRAAAGGRRRARGDAARPAVLVRGAAAGAGGVRHRRGRERAARADPRRLPGAGVLPAPGRGRAHPPGAEPGRGRAGAPRRRGAAGAGDRLRRRRAPPRLGRAGAAARRAARRRTCSAAARRAARPGWAARLAAFGDLRAGRLRRPRGPRRRPVPPVRHQGGGRRRPRLPAPRVPRRRPPRTSRTSSWARSAATSAPTARRRRSPSWAARRG